MKTKKFIQSGPHLPVKDLRKTLDFYRDTLGFSEEWTFGEKDGGISRDDLHLLFAEDPDFVADVNNHVHRLSLLWFVEDIEEVLSEFKERHVHIVDDLRTHENGLREFALSDINGYHVRVAEASEEGG